MLEEARATGSNLRFASEDAPTRHTMETRAVEKLAPIHGAQRLTCLRLASKQLGLLFNVNTPCPRDAIVRRAL